MRGPPDFEWWNDGNVFEAIDGSWKDLTSAIMCPADSLGDIHIGSTIEVRSIFIGYVGIGIAAIVVEMNWVATYWTGYHERARAERLDLKFHENVSSIANFSSTLYGVILASSEISNTNSDLTHGLS